MPSLLNAARHGRNALEHLVTEHNIAAHHEDAVAALHDLYYAIEDVEQQIDTDDTLVALYKWLARAHFSNPRDEVIAAKFGEQLSNMITKGS